MHQIIGNYTNFTYKTTITFLQKFTVWMKTTVQTIDIDLGLQIEEKAFNQSVETQD